MVNFKRSFSEIEDKTKLEAWSDKNPLKPCEIGLYSHKKAWFDCVTCGHEFSSHIYSITNGNWCSYCANNKLCDDVLNCQSCLPKTFYAFSDKDKLSLWAEKNAFNPWEVFLTSGKKAWFDCSKCGHEFQKSLDNVTNGGWCPYCVNNKLCEDVQNCQSCLPKTFYSFPDKDKVGAWAERNTFNPWEVFMTSGKKAWFDCRECGHEFESILSNITIHNSWCPFCSNSKICENSMTCEICLPKTFYGASDEHKVGAWSEKNEFSPWEVFRSVRKKAWFDCHECGHDFEGSLNDITTRDRWCPYCSHTKLCNDPRECEKCLPKTFYGGSDEYRVTSWSEKNTLQPWQVFLSSAKKVWFDCKDCGHEFQSALTDIKASGTWCPHCSSKRNKSIEKLCSHLENFDIKYKLESKIKLGGRSLLWDASCTFEDTEFFIESDGAQHFTVEGMNRVTKGKLSLERVLAKFNDQRARDLLKETYIRVNNGILFRFSYRQTSQIKSLVSKVLEVVKSGKTGVFYLDDIYW